jgi:hypothetical protein
MGMPDHLQPVYEVATGKLTYMHSIDAAEAVRLGDYTMTPPKAEIDAQERAMAMARAKGLEGAVHAELQTPEEREANRAAANAAAAQAGAQPVVIVTPAEESTPARATRQTTPASERK